MGWFYREAQSGVGLLKHDRRISVNASRAEASGAPSVILNEVKDPVFVGGVPSPREAWRTRASVLYLDPSPTADYPDEHGCREETDHPPRGFITAAWVGRQVPLPAGDGPALAQLARAGTGTCPPTRCACPAPASKRRLNSPRRRTFRPERAIMSFPAEPF